MFARSLFVCFLFAATACFSFFLPFPFLFRALDDERYFPWSEMYNVEVACFAVKKGKPGDPGWVGG